MKYFRILLTLIILVQVAVSVAIASPVKIAEYQNSKKELQRLRNTDIHVHQLQKWIDYTGQLLRFAQELPDDQAAESLFLVAKAYQVIASEKKDSEFLKKAVNLYSKVDEVFPESPKASTALYELFRIHEFDDAKKSLEYLKQLESRYPNSEYALFASEKIRVGVSKGGSKSKKQDEKYRTNQFTVVLDPGHGAEDLGAIGVGGLLEKDLVLEIALNTKKILDQDPSITTFLTRDTDEFIPLQQRTEFANSKNADLFVSIHSNASEKKSLSGFEIYLLDEQGDKAGLLLAERENASSVDNAAESPNDIMLMLGDLIQASKKPESMIIANLIKNSLQKRLAENKEYGSLQIKSPKKAPFYVLVGAFMPSVLVEYFYVDHPQDGILLSQKNFRRELSLALSDAIMLYKSQALGKK